jgi:exosortase
MSVDVLKAMGVIVMREGNIIMFPNITLEVVDACSGLRSLTSLLALGTAYALLFVRSPWQRLALVAATIPIAVISNTLRVTGTGLLACYFGAAAAEGFFHEFTGVVIFLLALVMLFGFHRLLRRFWP